MEEKAGEQEEDDHDRKMILYVFDLIPVRVTLLILYSVVFVFCFFGNLAVVLVTTFHHKMKTATKFFLGHLATANLCVAIFCIYQHISIYLAHKWIFGEFMCKMYHFVISLSHTASVFILVVTAVERYCVIIHPLRSLWLLTMRRKHLIILLVWVLSAVLSLHKFFYVTLIEHRLTNDHGEEEEEVICAMDVRNFNHKLADMITFILLFLLPLTIITILYTKIAIFLHEQHKRWTGQAHSNASSSSTNSDRPLVLTSVEAVVMAAANNVEYLSLQSSSERDGASATGMNSEGSPEPNPFVDCREFTGPTFSRAQQQSQWRSVARICNEKRRRVVKTLIIIAICFAVCNLPFYIQKILQNYFHLYESDNPWLELLAPLTFLLICVNCAVNPFLHALLNRNFQNCLKEILVCKHRRDFGRLARNEFT